MVSKVPSINISINLEGAPVVASTSKNVLLVGHRQINTGGNYLPLVPAQGYPRLTAYQEYYIPGQSTVQAYLSYMKNLGFALAYGESNTLSFPAPTSATVSGSTVTLVWSSAPLGYELLVGANIATTLTQATSAATGTVQSVSSTSYSIVLGNITGTFNTTNVITVSTINNNLLAPDPSRTDEIVMMVYRYAQAQVLNIPSPIATSAPNLYIAYLNEADNGLGTGIPYVDVGFGPVDDDIPVVDPASVAVLANGNTALYFTTIPTNFGLIPSAPLGSTTVTQATSAATGVIVGYINGLVPGGIGLELTDVTGTFNATNTLTVVLDVTQTVFELLTTQINYVASPYPVTQQSDITNPTFAPFYEFLTFGNANTSVNNGQFYVFGVVGNTTTLATEVDTLPVFDPGTFGAQYIIGAYTSYQKSLGDSSFHAAEIASFEAGLMALNDIPFNPMNKLATPLPVQSNIGTALKPTDAEAVLDLGWTPYVLNPRTLELQVVRNVTGLLYYPGSSSPDYTDFPVTNNQIIGLWKQSVFTLLEQPQYTNVRKSPLVKGSALKSLQGLATQFEKLGMFEFTAINNPNFTIEDDPIDPDAYDVYTPVVIAPETNAYNITTAVISPLVFTVTQA